VLFPLNNSGGLRRVVVTGVGVITPFGRGWASNAQGFREGKRAIGPVSLFDVSTNRSRIAAEIREDLELGETRLSRRTQGRLERAARMLLIASREAWEQAGWRGETRIPLILGTTSGGMTLGQEFYSQLMQDGTRRGQAGRIMHYVPQRQGQDLQQAIGFDGPITVIANACATGANVVGHAWEMIRSGQAERVFVGAYDAISQLVYTGFDALQALSPNPCRPFDAQRDGLTLGEGAAALAIESMESARSRGADILGEITGYGASTDPHHLTQPHPEGLAALSAMELACRRAKVTPENVGYLNAHGTATPHNDRSEAAAINAWAGEGASNLKVSSTKGSIGHTLGAAGAIEAAVCIMALREQWLPPNVEIGELDPAARFQLVGKPGSASFEYALTNSFGFGGANASLLLRRAA